MAVGLVEQQSCASENWNTLSLALNANPSEPFSNRMFRRTRSDFEETRLEMHVSVRSDLWEPPEEIRIASSDKKKRRYFYDPAGTHMQMRCMCEEAVGVLVGAAMSACLPAAAASGGGAGTARYEWRGWPDGQPETKRKQRRANTRTARSSCASPPHWVPARVLHLLLFSSYYFCCVFSVMLCICSLDLLLSVVHEAGSYRMDGSWKRHDCWDLGCEDVLSCFTYGRMGEVDFRFNIYLLRPFENLTVISLSYRAIFC